MLAKSKDKTRFIAEEVSWGNYNLDRHLLWDDCRFLYDPSPVDGQHGVLFKARGLGKSETLVNTAQMKVTSTEQFFDAGGAYTRITEIPLAPSERIEQLNTLACGRYLENPKIEHSLQELKQLAAALRRWRRTALILVAAVALLWMNGTLASSVTTLLLAFSTGVAVCSHWIRRKIDRRSHTLEQKKVWFPLPDQSRT